MPEPLLYVKAMATAGGASALVLLAVAWSRRWIGSAPAHAATVVALGLGQAIGYYVLQGEVRWPPVNGLERYFTIVLPAVMAVELVAGLGRVPRWVAWALRMCLAASVARVLLHGSVYLGGPHSDWEVTQTAVLLATCFALLVAMWLLLGWLSQRMPGVALPLSLALATHATGVAMMLAGYLNGGAACFPVAAAMAGVAVLWRWHEPMPAGQGAVSMGVVALFSLVVIGRFFGALTTGSAIVLIAAPLACWIAELPIFRRQKPWIAESIRLALVVIVLAAVLVIAKRRFDRTMGPLLVIRAPILWLMATP